MHHSDRASHWAIRTRGPLAAGWLAHIEQDELSHPKGTYVHELARFVPRYHALAYSGGPDSFILWRLLGRPQALYIDFGHESSARELGMVASVNSAFGSAGHGIEVREMLGVLREMPSGWIPYRNQLIITAVSQLHHNVVLARIAEWGPDKHPGYFRALERVMASSRGGHFQAATEVPRMRVWTPAGHLTKTQLVSAYLDRYGQADGAAELMTYTRSCYAARYDGKFCGQCGACWCRWVAFTRNGIDESDRYAQVPVRSAYYRRLDWHDFRPGMVPMYLKRAIEMRGMG
jgi:hypothetical protein